MPRFSRRSLSKLATCHPDLIRLMRRVVRKFDITIVSAKRTLEEQTALVAEGRSMTLDSKHLRNPSLAVDIAPWPIDWDDPATFRVLGGYVMGLAESLEIPLRWGGDWDGDWSLHDQRFDDLGHFELHDPLPLED